MFLSAAVVLVVTLAVMPGVIGWLHRRQIVDRPNHRSSHAVKTPRGAGLGPAMVAIPAALAVGNATTWWVALPAGFLAVVGLVDDVRDLPVQWRLPLQAIAAVVATAGMILATGAPPVWWVLGPLWIVGYVNAFNFMDGINGISGMHATIVGIVWTVMSAVAEDPAGVAIGALLAAAALGFLPSNAPRPKAFLGDVGSYFFGGWIAVGGVILAQRLEPVPVLLPTLVYVVDTTWTLVLRLRRGRRWDEAHRDHIYQQLVRGGWSHLQTTTLVSGLTAILGGLALWTLLTPGVAVEVTAVLLGLGACCAYLVLPRIVTPESAGLEPPVVHL